MSLAVESMIPRVEYKYLIGRERFVILKDLCDHLLTRDPNDHGTGYPVHSVYFDTQGYDYYHEKIHGEYFHRKARLRTYGLRPFSGPSYFEIKYKYHDDGYKSRVRIPDQVSLLDLGHRIQMASYQNHVILGNRAIFPVCSVFYQRKAYYLIGQAGTVRLNLDFDIACGFEGHHHDDYEPLFPDGEVVLEVKADHRGYLTDLTEILTLAEKGRTTFSKYISCMNVFYSHYLMEIPHEF
ncbi:MAG: VTC domain-containing protein [Proteobacteria bacterium]|nr:VTC domain-containing protein [Pseudomonadota bacterium]